MLSAGGIKLDKSLCRCLSDKVKDTKQYSCRTRKRAMLRFT